MWEHRKDVSGFLLESGGVLTTSFHPAPKRSNLMFLFPRSRVSYLFPTIILTPMLVTVKARWITLTVP